jgi:hypothetical protein
LEEPLPGSPERVRISGKNSSEFLDPTATAMGRAEIVWAIGTLPTGRHQSGSPIPSHAGYLSKSPSQTLVT